MHFKPTKEFSNQIGIVNKIAYHSGNTIYTPIENLTLNKMTENLKAPSEQKSRLKQILESKKEDLKVLENHFYELYKK